jgi:anhydro-N-acetylmuramic acid kinase
MDAMPKVIGLMSGTSLDGIDAALVATDGEKVVRRGFAFTLPYAPETRALLRAATRAAAETTENRTEGVFAEAERRLTEAHALAVRLLLDWSGRAPGDIALVGFHGQTVLHRPEKRRTWQIGDGALLARLTGIDAVNDFRSADVAAGGEGAPLVPLYHAALAAGTSALVPPVAVVNIGGVANVTYVGADILAFDTGPGNGPLDDWALRHTGRPADIGGRLALSGRPDEAALAAMLAHPYFRRRPPKSLDRADFGIEKVVHLSAADGAATLAAFAAASIARAAEHFPAPVSAWIVCGGGRRNPAIVGELAKRVSTPVLTAEAVGWNGDMLEAEAFAFLAVRSVRGLPLSLPATTGVPRPLSGGVFHRAKGGLP